MKVGIALNMLTQEGRPDAAVLGDHLALGDLAEPLGFDSLFALEHHFTGYAMSPSPTQLLSYFAGRTKRITLGTAVIVLPWHDPVRLAEEIALLDILSGGRCLLGFGRGAASVEYAGFRIPMEEARARFSETAQIVVRALSQDVFEWDGEFFKIPRTSIRPRPISHPERRIYASSVRGWPVPVRARRPHRRSHTGFVTATSAMCPLPRQGGPTTAGPGRPAARTEASGPTPGGTTPQPGKTARDRSLLID